MMSITGRLRQQTKQETAGPITRLPVNKISEINEEKDDHKTLSILL